MIFQELIDAQFILHLLVIDTHMILDCHDIAIALLYSPKKNIHKYSLYNETYLC